MTFRPPDVADQDLETNLEWNRRRWGQRDGWSDHDRFGYQWSGGYTRTAGDFARFVDDYFRPWTDGRHDLKILELAPGAGRFSAELIRYARSMVLVDLNEAAIELCRRRFEFYPTTPIEYCVNDGISLDVVRAHDFDMFACHDSMVHMRPEIIESYVAELPRILVPGGLAWLDHSGRGAKKVGHRTAMTAELMVEFASASGLEVVDQRFRNSWDCVSVLRYPHEGLQGQVPAEEVGRHGQREAGPGSSRP
jgi:SAM-dependent methyltransferase